MKNGEGEKFVLRSDATKIFSSCSMCITQCLVSQGFFHAKTAKRMLWGAKGRLNAPVLLCVSVSLWQDFLATKAQKQEEDFFPCVPCVALSDPGG